MKKLVLLFLFLSFSACLFAQDIIITQEDKVIEAKILKVYEAVIKYTLYNNQDETAYFLSKTKIKSITFENGDVEYFDEPKTNTAQPYSTVNTNAGNVKPQEKVFTNIVRLKPLATIIAAALGMIEVDIQYAHYFNPKVAIPVEVDVFGAPGLGAGFIFMTGIEAVPATHRQKSGLFLNALAGVAVYEGVGFIVNPNIGYQLVTKKGFVLNSTLGVVYNGLTKEIAPRFSIDVGFAF